MPLKKRRTWQEFLMERGERIRQTRRAIGWNRETLANMINKSAQSVGNWERGYCSMSPNDLAYLASALGVSVAYLQGKEETVEEDRKAVSVSPLEEQDIPDLVGALRQRIAQLVKVPTANVSIRIDLP